MSDRPLQEQVRPWAVIAAIVFYALLTVVFTHPLVRTLTTTLPHDLGDPLLNTWILWWNARQLPLSEAWWNAPAFYPACGSLAFSEHLLGLTPITSPVQWLGGTPTLAYNLAFLLSFPLSALSAHLLGLELTRRHDVALVGGLAFGFAPYRVAHLAHLQILSSYGMPLALLGLHVYLRTRRRRWLVLFAGAWALQGLSNGYFLFFFSVLVLLWLAWFVARPLGAQPAAGIAAVWLLAVLSLLPVLRGYQKVHTHYGLKRGIEEIDELSADVSSLLIGSPLLAHWGSWGQPRPEAEIYPGLTVGLLVVAGLAGSLRSPVAAGPERRRFRLVLAALAAVFALVALSAVTLGPWRVSLGGLTISVRVLEKPLSLAFVCLVAAAATGGHLSGAWRRSSPFAFYVLAAAAMGLLSLGPSPKLLGMPVLYKPPYAWLLSLPGFDALRAPARFAMPMALCLATAAALGLARLVERRPRWCRLLVGLAVTGVLWDGWITALPLAPIPESSPAPEAWRAEGSAVLELPLGGERDRVALFRGMSHGLPVVNGYSGYEPPHYAALRLALEARDDDALTLLASQGPLLVVIERRHDRRGAWRRYVLRHRGARVLQGGTLGVYVVPASPLVRSDPAPTSSCL
jgi:hypothetical protein